MDDFIDSYLVSLGFQTDEASFSKLKNALSTTESVMTQHTGDMVKRVLEFQGSIIGSFASVSAAILGVVDKAAMADQQYRLMGMSMFMTTEQARKMAMITSSLGASMEQIMWDPTGELHERANVLGSDIDRYTKLLGPGFEGGMKSIRDFRAEFGRLGVGLEFLGNKFAYDLWQKLAPGKAGQSFHDWITDMGNRIPKFSDKLVGYAVPALEKTWQMASAFGGVLEESAVLYSNLVGAITGDKSIEGAKFSFDHLATAISHTGDKFIQLFGWITKTESMLGHFAVGSTLLLENNYADAAKEFRSGFEEFNKPALSPIAVVAQYIDGADNTDIDTLMAIRAQRSLELERLIDRQGMGIGTPAHPVPTAPVQMTGFQEFLNDPSQWFKDGLAKSDFANMMRSSKLYGNGSDMDNLFHLSHPLNALGGNAPLTLPPATEQQTMPQSPLGSWVSPFADAPLIVPQASTMQSGLSPAAEFNERFARAIAQHENANPEWNNEGAIRKWGSTPTIPFAGGTMAVFPTKEAGHEALLEQIAKNEGRHLTALEFFAGKPSIGYPGYAPAKDHNNAEKYASDIAKTLGIDVNTPLDKIIQQMQPAMPVAPPIGPVIPPPALPPVSQLQYPWMAPPASDGAPQPIFHASYQVPVMAALPQHDWSAMSAELTRPIAPAPNVTTSNSKVQTIGDIHIHITEPGADVHEIKRAVLEAVREKQAEDVQVDISQLTANYS